MYFTAGKVHNIRFREAVDSIVFRCGTEYLPNTFCSLEIYKPPLAHLGISGFYKYTEMALGKNKIKNQPCNHGTEQE